ncbi:hypothetical protein N7481_008729 [Penicillium waksmanii]|uniref:uncharacterized protein n=1 Tax=Penicillium waksmanii TaxID=69791 RepID=UPI0025488F9A|nr:uncharacterized protein N7481_008729 [Penicillium waksmanii]KAJ5975022.1 hypothetical protein N7481_008729 [Penicillium waksmanii]
MSQVDQTHYDVYVAFGRKQFLCDPVHSLIIMSHPGAERCIRLHCEGWPGYWKPAIESNKRFQSWWIESKDLVAQIPASAGPIVEQEARAIPAQSSGLWASYLLLRLEKKGLIPEGIYEHWRDQLHIPATDEDVGHSSCF